MNGTTKKYNDLHTTAIGYLNRVRTVTPRQGDSYQAVSFTALMGEVTNPKYVYYDCNRAFGAALDKLIMLKDAINDDAKKVFVRVKLGDGYPDSYVIKDNKTGEETRRHVIKCRLLGITYASINGVEVEFASDADDQGAHSGEQNASPTLFHFNEGDLDEYMVLEENDPAFEEKKKELVSLGYAWDSTESAWYRPVAA